MPGYGYASVPKSKVASWTELIHKFLLGRASLARVYVLIDARHGLKDADLDVLKTLDKSAVSYQVVLTKADQVEPDELQSASPRPTAAIVKHPAAFPEVLATSARAGAGMAELRAAMVRLLDGARLMAIFRILIGLAAIMGADGVILAALSAHQDHATQLEAASSMLLFHAPAVLAVAALAERGIVHGKIAMAAAVGFVVASALFAGDLTLRQFAGHRLFPVCRADRRHALDRKLADASGRGGLAAEAVV